MRTTKSSSTTRMARLRAKEKLQKQFDDLQAELAKIPLSRQHRTPQYRKLARLWTSLHPDAPASTEKPQSTRISGSDATLHGTFYADIKDSGKAHISAGELEAGSKGIFRYGVLADGPTEQGPRSNCPSWLLHSNQRDKVARRLVREKIAKHPRARLVVSSPTVKRYKLEREERAEIVSEVNDAMKLLHYYFVDRRDFTDPWVLVFLPDGIFDQTENGDTKPAQRHIKKLVDAGYRLLGLEAPTEESREIRRNELAARKNEVIEKAQFGRGADPRSFESEDEEGSIAKFKDTYNPDKQLRQEFSRLQAEDETRARQAKLQKDPQFSVVSLSGKDYADITALKLTTELCRLSLLGRLLGKLTTKWCDARKSRLAA